MTLQERIARYPERDFSEDQARILTHMEEAAIALFGALPDHFVLVGGATLVLSHNVHGFRKTWTCSRESRRCQRLKNSKRHFGLD
jgi:hypothetical protein